MDNLTHSLVGLSLSKAGLERVSPYATTVCLLSANAADADFVALFFGDRWTLLHHHRGITHSIVGTIAVGLIVPLIIIAIERIIASLKKQKSRIKVRGLLFVSMIAAATHPLMDWTNNYGVRPLLPWSNRWVYGDFVFIVDPYIWLLLGATVFLLTSKGALRMTAWVAVGAITTAFILFATVRGGADTSALRYASFIWAVGLIVVVTLRFVRKQPFGSMTAVLALMLLVLYWGGLALAHHFAFASTQVAAEELAEQRGSNLTRVAAMPIAATPFRWQSVAETNRAIYRYYTSVAGFRTDTHEVRRFEKPTGPAAALVASASQDRRAREFLLFARFPIGEPVDANCLGQTLVQFADIRYTEPGATRGAFSVNIPVDCPAR